MKRLAQHRQLVLVLAAAAALAVSGLRPAAALAAAETDMTQYDRIPVSGTMSIGCLGEDVAVTGEIWGFDHSTLDAAGQIHSAGHGGQFHGTGVGLISGRSYILIGGTQDTYNASSGVTTVYTTRAIGQGPGNDYVSTIIVHYTRTPSGELVVESEKVIADGCR